MISLIIIIIIVIVVVVITGFWWGSLRERSGSRWKDNIKVDLQQVGEGSLCNKNEQDALFYSQFISVIYFHMFRAGLLLIIRRYMLCVYVSWLQAGSGWN